MDHSVSVLRPNNGILAVPTPTPAMAGWEIDQGLRAGAGSFEGLRQENALREQRLKSLKGRVRKVAHIGRLADDNEHLKFYFADYCALSMRKNRTYEHFYGADTGEKRNL